MTTQSSHIAAPAPQSGSQAVAGPAPLRSHRRLPITLLVAGLVVLSAALPVWAAPNASHDEAARPQFEIVVVEAASCTYCPYLRRDLEAAYRNTLDSSVTPVRYVDVNDIGTVAAPGIVLRSALSQVPTTLVLSRGREIGRVEGYWAREPFLMMVTRILNGAGVRLGLR